MEVLDIGIDRPAILPPTIVMMMEFLLNKFLKFLQGMEDVDLGLKRPAILPLEIVEFIVVVI